MNSILTSYKMEEGCYPLEANEENLERLGTLDHQDISMFKTQLVDLALSGSNWSPLVLGNNVNDQRNE